MRFTVEIARIAVSGPFHKLIRLSLLTECPNARLDPVLTPFLTPFSVSDPVFFRFSQLLLSAKRIATRIAHRRGRPLLLRPRFGGTCWCCWHPCLCNYRYFFILILIYRCHKQSIYNKDEIEYWYNESYYKSQSGKPFYCRISLTKVTMERRRELYEFLVVLFLIIPHMVIS